ncbi:CRISPR-associated endonuclease Cas2 [Halanaeroarchaeum sulfurireducens]|uniref:CRISPR-associated endoribonuclease Cas2 n=1 Tax=Halanaeroarchaeum sulfurireducens TaxID=1604004 RepID=A0A0F7PDC7_9EURY|nr:CRISPR-associated endonuclease Cas2 [Halanaeroarchaeum sulfurireducens]AKH97363.1 CRISPR-associated protein Cas2 [Halanaeroarchaeum sulfurireducens]ALG81765.1 CRISPR-associated protein Cas2 [Halanaeroarchaeum sulfurireducens]
MVYVVVVYDVQAHRTQKFLKFLRQYLVHVQNSVFEGEVTEGDIEEIKHRLESMLEDEESVILYRMASEKYVTRTVYGTDPAADDQFL